MREQVMVVNKKDEPIGLMDKLEAHEKGVLHEFFKKYLNKGIKN